MAGMEGYNLRELADLLGLPGVPAARIRVNLMRDVLVAHGWLRRGPNNELLVTAEGVELLRRLEEYRGSGFMTLAEAKARIVAELGGADAQARAALERLRALETRVEALEAAVARLQARWWRRFLRLRLPALKPPQRRE